MVKEQVMQKIRNLIYYNKLNEAWDLAMANPIVHSGKNKPHLGVKSESGRWILLLPVVSKPNPTLEQKQAYYKSVDTKLIAPQLEGNRFIYLT